MARYVVTVNRTIYESAEIEIEAETAEEAGSIAFDQVASGDVEFEFDDTYYEIDNIESEADWFLEGVVLFLDQYASIFRTNIRILFLDEVVYF